MVTLTPDQAIIIGFPITIFIIRYYCLFYSTYITQTPRSFNRRFVRRFFDYVNRYRCFLYGWWYYPSSTTPYGPLGYYALTAIFYGAGIALLGWRVNRRFGLKGITTFIILFGVYGVTRDFTVSAATQTSNLIVFASGIIPLLADALSWITIIATTQLVMWIIAGPAKADKLRP